MLASLQVTRGILVGALPPNLTPDALRTLRREVLGYSPDTRVRGVVLDASRVEVMDGNDYRSLSDTLQMCRVMGRPAIVCGLAPGVVSALMELDVDPDALTTARDVEAAIVWLHGGPP